jgi:squalene-associated FAD-dependent desaturase
VTAPVVVVGAGWSGLACALVLAARGLAPRLIDAAPAPGGRARSVQVRLAGKQEQLDNGQHVLVGACTSTFAAIEQAGVLRSQALAQQDLAIAYPDGWRLQIGQAPSPLHLVQALVGARGPSMRARLQLARWVLGRPRGRQASTAGLTAAQLFGPADGAWVQRLWRPLCLAALNCPLEQASAAIFLRVLEDSLMGGTSASRLWIPRRPLGEVFPQAALGAISALGGTWEGGSLALGLEVNPQGAVSAVRLRGGHVPASAVVLALPPHAAARLLASAGPLLAPPARTLAGVDCAPIATVYLQYPAGTRLPCPAMVLADDAAAGRPAQWVFDHGQLDRARDGRMAAVISGTGPHLALGRAELAAAVMRQLQSELGLPAALDACALLERRATVLPGPGLRRPPVRLPVRGLYLAGDAADSPYPSTLEGSVRAGQLAAQALLEDRGV